jgi:hypothetical protein
MFIDPAGFDFVAALESRWREIRRECEALPDDAYDPWVQREMYGDGWTVYGLLAFGTPIEPALARCPQNSVRASPRRAYSRTDRPSSARAAHATRETRDGQRRSRTDR